MMKPITGLSLEHQLLISERPIVVDVWAVWCGPCRKLTPMLERISDRIPEAMFYTVDADEEEEVTDRYDIRSIPTVLLFNEGKLVDSAVGAASSEARVEQWIRDTVGLH